MGTRPLKKIQVDERITDQKVSSRYSSKSLINKNIKPKQQSRGEVITQEAQVPLTPLHRLQRFKKIRDRNLRKERKKLSQVRLRIKKEMETKVEDVANVIPKANEINNIKGKTVQKNEKTSDLEQNGSSAENGIFSEEKQSENHQARRSLRILKEKEEADEKSKLETNEEISAGKSQLSSENSSPIDNSTAKNKTSSKLSSPKKNLSEKSNNDQVSSDAEIPTIDEKEESEIEKIEEKKQSEPSSEYKILRRSVRISESLNSSPGSSSVSSLKLDEPTSYRHSRENYLGRVTGRRPVRGHLTPYRKRKITDDPEESIDDSIGPNSKRTAVDSPSVKSPGWKYLPSLNKLWSPREDMSEGISVVSSTPYRSATQYSDSMVVNYDEKTVQRFQDSDVEGVEETTPSSGWYCSLM